MSNLVDLLETQEFKNSTNKINAICTKCGYKMVLTPRERTPIKTKQIRYVCSTCRSDPIKPFYYCEYEYLDSFGNLILASPNFIGRV